MTQEKLKKLLSMRAEKCSSLLKKKSKKTVDQDQQNLDGFLGLP